ASPLAYAGPVALCALALSAAWCAYAWLTPDASLSYTGESVVPDAPAIAFDRATVDERSDRLALLAQVNRFDNNLAFWIGPNAALILNGASLPDRTMPTPEPDELLNDPTTTELARSGDVALTAEDDLPDDVKAARKNLELKGLYLDPAGAPAAMIGYVNQNRGSTVSRRPGDHFTDPTHDASPWVVGRVQLDRRRVVLVRSGATIALDLFPEGQAPPAIAQAQPVRQAQTGAVRVQSRSRDEIVRDLREAGVSEADILAAVRLMDLPTDDLDLAPPAVVTLTPATPELTEDDVNETGASAPQGMDQIMRMMQEMQREAEERRNNRDR
ncbi:MAG: hypothetical protein AAGH64_10085, partial [Planctomycetota bacterium]